MPLGERGIHPIFFGEPVYDPEIHGVGAAIGVRKEDAELRDKLSAAILAIRGKGVYGEISERYFGMDIYGS